MGRGAWQVGRWDSCYVTVSLHRSTHTHTQQILSAKACVLSRSGLILFPRAFFLIGLLNVFYKPVYKETTSTTNSKLRAKISLYWWERGPTTRWHFVKERIKKKKSKNCDVRKKKTRATEIKNVRQKGMQNAEAGRSTKAGVAWECERDKRSSY